MPQQLEYKIKKKRESNYLKSRLLSWVFFLTETSI